MINMMNKELKLTRNGIAYIEVWNDGDAENMFCQIVYFDYAIMTEGSIKLYRKGLTTMYVHCTEYTKIFYELPKMKTNKRFI